MDNMVCPRLKVFWGTKDNPIGHTERKMKKSQTEEEAVRQYQEWTGLNCASLTQAHEYRTR